MRIINLNKASQYMMQDYLDIEFKISLNDAKFQVTKI